MWCGMRLQLSLGRGKTNDRQRQEGATAASRKEAVASAVSLDTARTSC
jgi:hypothetical protein